MASPTQHACNRESATDPSIFRNDTNNVTALQLARLQQLKLKEAEDQLEAQRGQTELVMGERTNLRETVERLKKELDGSNEKITKLQNDQVQLKDSSTRKENDSLRDKTALEQTVAQKERELINKNNEIQALKTTQTQMESTIQNLKTTAQNEVNTLRNQKDAEIATKNTEIGILKRQLPGSRQDNSLPAQYHNATVMFVNLGSQMALDAGKDNGTRAHAWQYDVSNQNQIFKLTRASGDLGPDGYWMISRKNDNMRLYYPNANEDNDVHVISSAPGRQDYWYIGRGASNRVGSWIIKNAEWNTTIELANSNRENGIRAKSYPPKDHSDTNWVIIPVSFD